jgi:glycosyltransferase involved in cell wall biosynthesis
VPYAGKTFHFQNLKLRFSPENLYVLSSPIMCLEAWRAMLYGVPALIVEEYFSESRSRDLLVSSLLLPFRSYPFVSFTKRTHAFLEKRSFNSFLIPPAERKQGGSKNRDMLLYVSRMIESKKPFLVLELARQLESERFVMVGKGPLLPHIKKRAEGMSNVEIIEFVETREELFRDYYAKAKALLHPAEKDAVGFVVVEALASSTPVLASAGVGASDYLPETWRVGTRRVGEWVRKIGALSDDDVRLAEKTFEQENLDIESSYFRETGQMISAFLTNRGWL